MKLTPNGIVIQQVDAPEKNFDFPDSYRGIHAYTQFPLTWIAEPVCRELTYALMFEPQKDGTLYAKEFITSPSLARKYIEECRTRKIPIRIFFVESDYIWEKWEGTIPQGKYLGCELCELPFDLGIVTELYLLPAFSVHRDGRNADGLFSSPEAAESFRKDFLRLVAEGRAGDDGPEEAFICRIYEVDEEAFLC